LRSSTIFLVFFIFILILHFSFADIIEPSVSGATTEVVKKDVISLNVVDSSSIRIGNLRQDSISNYKMTVLDVKDTYVILKYQKFQNLTISLGQERKLDFDGDNVFDIGILLFNLRPNRATLVIKSLENTFKELPVEKELNNTEIAKELEKKLIASSNETKPNETKEIKQEVKQETEIKVEKKSFLSDNILKYSILSVIVFVFIILVIIILIYMRRKRIKLSYNY